jgi:HK97 gp10 family phage protein
MAFAIEIKNLDRIQENFTKAPKIMTPILQKGITEAGAEIVRTEVEEAPHDTGNLQRSVQFRMSGMTGIIQPLADYAGAVQFGTKPHMPPANALRGWAMRHNMNAFLVARAISRKGTKANPFITRTVKGVSSEVNKIFQAALKQMTKALAKI